MMISPGAPERSIRAGLAPLLPDNPVTAASGSQTHKSWSNTDPDQSRPKAALPDWFKKTSLSCKVNMNSVCTVLYWQRTLRSSSEWAMDQCLRSTAGFLSKGQREAMSPLTCAVIWVYTTGPGSEEVQSSSSSSLTHAMQITPPFTHDATDHHTSTGLERGSAGLWCSPDMTDFEK